MNNKLKRVAKNLSELIENYDTHQEVYQQLRNIYMSHREYFSKFKPSELLELTFYIKSYLDYNDFRNGEIILNNSFITGLFYLSDIKHEEVCTECGGTGSFICPECDREGEVNCTECGGDGYDYEERCEVCGGDGIVTCDNCGGYGEFKCDDCNGYGWYETDSEYFTLANIISWSDSFKLRCMDIKGNPNAGINPNLIDVLKDKDKMIILHKEDDYKEFEDSITYDKFYCVGVSDSLDDLKVSSEFELYKFLPISVKEFF